MKLPGDPATEIKKISDSLNKKAEEDGMGAVNKFLDNLEGIKEKVSGNPTAILDEVKGKFDEFKSEITDILNDPASLAPSGLAACASWYGGEVAKKLKSLSDEVTSFVDAVVKMVGDLTKPLGDLKTTIENALKELEGSAKKLGKLPNDLAGLADTVKGADDVAKIDTAPMKDSLKVDGVAKPLEAFGPLKDVLKSAVAALKDGVVKLIDFIASIPDKVKKAFDLPAPICFLQSALMSQAPAPMKTLMDKTDAMKNFDMEPMKGVMENISDTIGGLDTDKVVAPIKKFAESAKDPVESLDALVKTAKMASGGALGGFKSPF